MTKPSRIASVLGVTFSLLLLRAAPSMASTSGFAQVACGGARIGTYVADTDFSGGSPRSRTNLIDIANIANPAPMAVYLGQRYGDFSYTFSGLVASSVNVVRLHFADTHWTTTGQRSFNVSINGTQVLSSFDIVAKAGAGNRALVETFTVSATSAGKYVIAFTTVKDAATVSGIEVLSLSTPMKGNWLQFGGDAAHTGVNLMETKIGPSNYTKLAPVSGWTKLPTSQAPPVVVTNVTSPSGVTDIAFVNNDGYLTGLSPSTGVGVWPKSAVPGSGGEASPAIDPNLKTVYNIGGDHCVHKYDIATGGEYVGAGAGALVPYGTPPPACLSNGWPAAWAGGMYVKTSLTIGLQAGTTNKFLYLANCNGNGAFGNVTTINITDGAGNGNQTVVSGMSGGWARAGLTFDLGTQRLLAPTVDGAYSPPTPSWGYAVIALNPDGTGPIDSFTPDDPVLGNDWDLGSTNTLVLPLSTTFPPAAQYTHLGLQSGKDGHLRLLNLANLNGTGSPSTFAGNTDVMLEGDTIVLPTLGSNPVCGESGGACPISSPISAWYEAAKDTTWMYVNSKVGLNVLELVLDPIHGHIYLQTAWTTSTAQINAGGTSVANGVLYYANANNLFACNAEGPASSCKAVGPGSGSHQTPVVINGILYYNGAAYTVPF